MDAIGAPFCHYHRVCGWGFFRRKNKKRKKKIFPLFFELFSSYFKIEFDRNVKKVFLMPSGSLLSISIVIITKGRRNGLTCRPPSAQDEETYLYSFKSNEHLPSMWSES